MRKTITATTEQTITTCDLCESKVPLTAWWQCRGCGCDLCRVHDVREVYDAFTGDDCGDYPSHYCLPCVTKLDPYRAKVSALRAAFEDEIEQLKAEWKAECTIEHGESALSVRTGE